MGDRYTLNGLSCPYCLEPQDDVYYAESSGVTTHKCDECGRMCDIAQEFVLKKMPLDLHPPQG